MHFNHVCRYGIFITESSEIIVKENKHKKKKNRQTSLGGSNTWGRLLIRAKAGLGDHGLRLIYSMSGISAILISGHDSQLWVCPVHIQLMDMTRLSD